MQTIQKRCKNDQKRPKNDLKTYQKRFKDYVIAIQKRIINERDVTLVFGLFF